MLFNTLKIGCLNVRSLVPSFANLVEVILSESFDIFCVVETWLHNGIDNNLLHINDFTLFRCDRGSRGGGLCAFVKNIFNISIISTPKNIEQLWLNINLKNEKIALGIVYKPPTLDSQIFFNEMEDTLSLIAPTVDDIICLGDFNINVLNLHNAAVDNLFSLLDEFKLKQIIDTPTRITDKTTSLIDLILVLNYERIMDKGVIENQMSDHLITFCLLETANKLNEPRMVTYRNFKNFDYNSFELDLFSIPWYSIFDMNNSDDKVLFLTSNIIQLVDRHAPLITSRFTKPPAPWLTDNIRLMISLKEKALKKYKTTKSVIHLQYYKDLRNFTNQSIKREKKAYFEYKIKNSSSKEKWQFFKHNNLVHSNKKKDLPSHLKKPNEVNSYFADSVPNATVPESTLEFYKNNFLNNNSFKFQFVNNDTVAKIISGISTNATGCDGVNIRILELCCPHLIPYITHIVNFCLAECEFPTMWKSAVVTVLPKKSKPENFKDLRGISILPTISKILEKVIEQQVRVYLVNNNILPTVQSGFRPGHSCTTALLHIVDDVIEATDQGLCTVLILLDFSRAFDTVNHELLKAILGYLGFAEEAIRLFDSFLRNRKQKVKIDDKISSSVDLKCGVPQGSILGPLLFTLYTSHLITNLKHCKIHLYADDTELYYSFRAPDVDHASALINDDLANFIKSAEDHCLLINPKKSNIIVFGPKKQRNIVKTELHILIDNNPLEALDQVKSLGVLIDSDLRFVGQVNDLVQKAYVNLKYIYGNRYYLTQSAKILLCETLVLSLFNYADSLYGPCLTSISVNKIQKVQNSCLRLIYGIRKYERISHKLKEIKWLNMKNRRLHHSACLFHNIVINKTPSYLHNKIKFRTDVHTLNIRFKGLLTPPIHQTELFKRSFRYQICKVYNGIDKELKTCTIGTFKHKFKSRLLLDQSLNN